MNELQTLTDVSPELDLNALLKRSRLEPGSEDAVEFETLLAQVQAVAEPKAIYREAYIEHRGEDTITVDGVTFTSLTLRRNLEEVECVFPYVATCGTEIDQADPAGGEMLRQFWVDMIKEELLSSSMRHLKDYLERRHAIKKTTRMSPGAGDISVWAIEESRTTFGTRRR